MLVDVMCPQSVSSITNCSAVLPWHEVILQLFDDSSANTSSDAESPILVDRMNVKLHYYLDWPISLTFLRLQMLVPDICVGFIYAVDFGKQVHTYSLSDTT